MDEVAPEAVEAGSHASRFPIVTDDASNTDNPKSVLNAVCQAVTGSSVGKGDVTYVTTKLGAAYTSVVRLVCFPDEEYIGEPRGTAKEAEQSAAAKALAANEAVLATLQPKQRKPKLHAAMFKRKAAEFDGGHPNQDNPQMRLSAFCQAKCGRWLSKNDIEFKVVPFGESYQAIVKLHCLTGEEYAGEVSPTAEMAEMSAAQQGLLANAEDIEYIEARDGLLRSAPKRRRQDAWEWADRPAPESKMFLKNVITKILNRPMTFSDFIFETEEVPGGWWATLRIPALADDWEGRSWEGRLCQSKKDAELSASSEALDEFANHETLWTVVAHVVTGVNPIGRGRKGKDKGKGKGKGKDRPRGPDLPRERITAEPVLGEVLEWRGEIGFIQPLEAIEHELWARRKGKIYVHMKDLTLQDVPAEGLAQGTQVQFHVYTDASGFGAEEVITV